jgi:hypothetical protein
LIARARHARNYSNEILAATETIFIFLKFCPSLWIAGELRALVGPLRSQPQR